MSRTTQAQLRTLMREARIAVGVKTNRQLQASLEPYKRALEAALPQGSVAIMITPHRDNRWLVYWVDQYCREQIRSLTLKDLNLTPDKFARKYAVTRPGRHLNTNTLNPSITGHSATSFR